ncbi:Cytochrome P450 monooxygenase nodJ [Paramyrothecium foliicola]|nr:Cytochrome P450 monooxygenase nodJ [Paramyrothecium foliicola]
MPSTIVLALGFVGAAYVFLAALLNYTQDPKEPPMLETSIPFVSPMFGFLPGMPKFLVKLRDKYNLPIYTLRMPGSRIYVVNSLSLIPQVQKQYKTIAFEPIAAQAAATVMDVGPAGNAIIGADNMFEEGSYLDTFVPYITPALAPGPGLDAITGTAARVMADSLAEIGDRGPAKVELFAWVRRQIFMAETETIYGLNNPFRDSKLETAWYDFEPGIMFHMLKAWPSILAPKSLHARDKLLIPAFEKYFDNKLHLEGSLLVQCHYNHNIHHGLRGRDVAATEIGHMVAALTNSLASAYWMVYYIYSNPTILSELREELEKLVKVNADGVSTIDLAQIKTSTPILLSTWQETLRYVHIGISARVVMEDVLLDNRYLLKKGATVMTAAPIQHSDPALWGPTVGTFDHRRFLREPGKKRTSAAAFRTFGGGHVLCPGRHFVSTFIMSFAALLVLRFDMKPLSKDGMWSEPRKDIPMTSSMPTPKDDVHVELRPRDNRKWHVDFSASSKGFSMVAEDEGGH